MSNLLTKGTAVVGALDSAGPINGKKTVSIKAADFTLTAADSGSVFIADAVDLTVTLPATAAGLEFTFVVATVSVTTGLSISPVTADYIAHTTAVVDKDLINTGATDVIGDSVTIVGDGVDGWFCTSLKGTWAKEG